MTDDQRPPEQPGGGDQPQQPQQPQEPEQPAVEQPTTAWTPPEQPTPAWTPPPAGSPPTPAWTPPPAATPPTPPEPTNTGWTPPAQPTPAWTPPASATPPPPPIQPTDQPAPYSGGTGPLLSAAPSAAAPTGWVAAPDDSRREVAPGLVFSDTPSRFVAFVIDLFLLGIVSSAINSALVTPASFGSTGQIEMTMTTGNVIATVLSVLVSAAYFVGFWSGGRRATLGQLLLKIQVGNAFDGRPLSLEQAFKRWIGLGEFLSVFAITIGTAAAVSGLGLIWSIVLLITTATSPTKQGLHDRFANSAVVRPASAGRGAAWACVVIVIGLVVLALLSIIALFYLGGQISGILSAVGESV